MLNPEDGTLILTDQDCTHNLQQSTMKIVLTLLLASRCHEAMSLKTKSLVGYLGLILEWCYSWNALITRSSVM